MIRNVKLDQARRVLAMILAIIMLMPFVPANIFATTSSGVLQTNLDSLTFYVGEEQEFYFQTIAGSDENTMVKGSFEFSNPEARASLKYLEHDGEWYEFDGDFGPAEGFPMKDATSYFKAIFNRAGTYTVEAQIVSVDDGSVICSTTSEIKVESRSALDTTIGDEVFYVGQTKGFTFTTIANEDAGKNVVGCFEFSDDEAVETLEYYDHNAQDWVRFYGDFGPADGFEMMDNVTSNFRVKFKKAGVYKVKAYMKTVPEGYILCSTEKTVVVNGNSELTTTIGDEVFVIGEEKEFTFTTIANDDAGRYVLGSFVFEDPDAVETLYYYDVNAEDWCLFNGDFGPEGGFPMQNAASRFKATFKKAGVFTVEAYIKTADGEYVLCSTEKVVVVNGNSQLTTNLEEQTYVVGTPAEFEFTTVANGDADRYVLAEFACDDSDAALFEYYDNDLGEWIEFESEFGPAGGFQMKDNETQRLRATFTKSGIHKIDALIKTAEGGYVLCATDATVTVNGNSELSTDMEEQSYVVGDYTYFTFSTKANNDAGRYVLGSFAFSHPEAKLSLQYLEHDGEWYEFDGDFGPAGGFPMIDGVSHFRVAFKSAGVYKVDAYMKLADGGFVLCSTSATISVTGKSSLSTNIDQESFGVGVPKGFEFSTIAKEDAGKKVIASFEFSDPEAKTSLQYLESDGEWYEFDGDFGPAEGFDLKDATSYFKAIFNKAGTYEVTVYLKEVGTEAILCYTTATVTVKETSDIYFENNHLEFKYTDKDIFNDSLKDAVQGSEYTFVSDNESVVKVDSNGFLTPVGVGEATITVTRKEDADYVSATASYTVKVVPGIQAQLVWENTVPNSVACKDPNGYFNTVTGGSGTGEVTYTSNNPEVAEVDPKTGVLTMKKAGEVTITATKDGAGLYEAITASYTLVIVKSEQAALNFVNPNPDAIFVGSELVNIAVGGSTGGTVVYTSSDPTIATVDPMTGKVTALRVPAELTYAEVTITATLAGDDAYVDAIPVSYTVTIYRAPQKTPLVFEKGETEYTIKYGEEFANPVSGGDTFPFTYKSSDATVASVDENGKITTYKAGEVTITASVPQSEIYQAQTLSYKLKVELAPQEVKFENGVTNIPALVFGSDPYTNKATATTTITYKSSDDTIATVDENGKVVALSVPILMPDKDEITITITATAAQTEQYAAASASYDITIKRAQQEVIFANGVTNIPDLVIFADPYENIATATTKITYQSSDPTIATVDENGKVTALRVPMELEYAVVTITATAERTEQYATASASYTIIIRRAQQEVVFDNGVTNIPDLVFGAGDYENKATAKTNITYSAEFNGAHASVDKDGKVSFVGVPLEQADIDVTITATAEQTEQYSKATASYSIKVKKAEQEVIFKNGNTNIPDIIYGASYRNTATAKTKISYSSNIPEVAEVLSDGNLKIHKSGTVIITAIAEETTQYLKAVSSYEITIQKAPQPITWSRGELVQVTFNDNQNRFENVATSNATRGDDNDKKDIVVTYSIVSGQEFVTAFDAATGSFVITGAGTISVMASFTGNERYNGNTSVYTLIVNKAPQYIAFSQSEYAMYNGDINFVSPKAYEVSLFYGTGIIGYEIIDNQSEVVSYINPNTGELTFTHKTGTVTVRATKPADANYLEATTEYTLVVADKPVSYEVTHELWGDKLLDDSGWYVSDVSLLAAPGYLISYEKEIGAANWVSSFDRVITADGGFEITFHAMDMNTGIIYEAQTVSIFKDETDPSAQINHENLTGWDKFLSIITLGMWEPEQMRFSIYAYDDTSEVSSVEYLVVEGTTEIMHEVTLEEITDEWKTYDEYITVPRDTTFVIYAKVMDNAGNYIYASTNGIVFDRTPVAYDNIKINVVTPNQKGFYNSDVELNVSVSDAMPSSGINSITYEVFNNGVQTQKGTLFSFENDNPTYDQLVPTVDGLKIIVDSNKNNSDYVVVKITVADNAGNISVKEIPLKICINKPVLEVNYIDDPESAGYFDGVTYYDTNRKAEIVITYRTSVFNTSDLPKCSVTEFGGNTVIATTYKVIDWVTHENEGDPDAATHVYTIEFNGSANYEFNVNFVDIFGNAVTHTSNKFAVDHEKPTASITVDDSTWSALLEKLTFGLWKNKDASVSATYDDATSPIKRVDIYRTDSTYILNSSQLEELYESGKFVAYAPFTVSKDERFVVYLRVEDYAGHYDYISSDGFVVDMTDSEITITPDQTELSHNGIPLYNGNVDVRIDVAEKKDESYSGIKEVKYWVTCDGVKTQEKVLYTFDYKQGEVPHYEDLLHEFTETVTIEAAKNNSCDVVLYVSVTDNAGNEYTKFVKVDIDVTDPTIKVTYDNNSPYKTDGERGYYPANRTATIVINERTGHFEANKATAGIKIKAVDAKGNTIVVNGTALEVDDEGYLVDISKLFGTPEWRTEEGATPDAAIHTLVLPYNYDANYTFDISYADLAGNGCEGVNTEKQNTPYEFTVDKVAPTATITVAPKTWDELLTVLTFGLFSNEGVKISATSDDVTSPIESIEYYKTDATEILSADELRAITDWTDITTDPEFEISNDERFVVYLKVTDYSGNYLFINSDGYIVDKTQSVITLTPERTELTHNNIPLYNGDVDVLINVAEKEDESYSGIKEVKYWVTCEGEVSQPEEVLYSFDKVSPKYEELLHKFVQTVTIESLKNNSCNVVLYVTVTDNAGNVKTESVAVDIDIVCAITVDFDNDSAYKVVDGKGYFPSNRTATVVITERTAHFDAQKATEGIKITAVDARGKAVIEDCSALISSWTTQGTGDDATHTATIDFSADANYDFTLSYKDLASNECKYEDVVFVDGTVAPRYFAVDKNAPSGSVSAGNLGIWDKLINILTFGLWSKDDVDVTGTSDDITTPIEGVFYYKTSDTTAKSEADLKKINSWKTFDGTKGITVRADEKFIVYLKIVDSAGNTTYISTDGIVVDDTMPSFATVKPEITITPEPTNGIYNSDVTVGVSVVDPKSGDTEAYAGLKEIRYEVYSLGKKTQSGVLYSFEYGQENGENVLRIYNKGELVSERKNYSPTFEDLMSSWADSKAIIVNKDLNNSNDVKVVVYAVDNTNNTNSAMCSIKIDTTPAKIEVSYDNNNGDTNFADSTYFKANRTATITVTERNFNPEYFKYVITNTDGYIPVISAWETKVGVEPNGDDTTHTATILFDKDGDYQFTIESCIDEAVNNNIAPDTGDSLTPWSFTIDKTAPVVSVVYDNNTAVNGNYYSAQRVATITVTEHNFETVSGRLKIKLVATDDGVEVSLPVVSKWTSNGDVHTATITFASDALYVFDFDYSDKAGNATADIAEQTFYVDKTNPVLTIENIVDETANSDEGNIGFVMTATDTNFDVFTPVLTAVIKNGDAFETKQLEIGELTDIKNGKVLTVTNLEDDGLYRITCTVVDKAGNAYTEVILENADGSKYTQKRAGADTLITFSVNREGSTFVIDENTLNVIQQYYIQHLENDIEIIEINADPLKEFAVTLNDKTLEKDKDYTVTEEGGNGSWMKYTYHVNKTLFADEGEYKLVVFSKDKADSDAFSDIKETAIAFVVDRTAPVITVSGIANDGRYQTENQIVTLIPTDDGGELKTLIVNMIDEEGNIINEVINLSGDALMAELEANDGMITFGIAEGLYQNVQIICTDCATDGSGATNAQTITITNVSVSSSIFMIFWADKLLRWSTIGGVSAATIGVAVFAIIRKKKLKTK